MSLLLHPGRVDAWATAEHIRFGQQIATPFEDGPLADRLPVLAAASGPQTFGHWVSAPDFARGLVAFLNGEPMLGGTACSATWNSEGVVDGEVVDDQNIADHLGYLDCLDTWRMNNSHFGDFAAYHFAHYHRLALEAARRYARTRQPACREAAYTLEGWGQHYLTDATAVGHAWNPAGSYEASFDWQTTNAVTQRMRIHNALNEGGGRFAGSLYDLGTMRGDHSETYLPASVPELEGDPQRALTLYLARMSLAQVVMAGECRGPVDGEHVLAGGDEIDDPRRMYASDETMCGVMYGEELGSWLGPEWFEDLGVDMTEVLSVVDACRTSEGYLSAGVDGALLARHWFQDKYYESAGVDGHVSSTVDPASELDLAELGCGEDLEVLPVTDGELDACGMLLCPTPPTDGRCGEGTTLEAGCCLAKTELADGGGTVTATPWTSAPAPTTTTLGAAGAVDGESPEFLWFDRVLAPFAAGQAVRLDEAEPATLLASAPVIDCGGEAAFSVHEARVVVPDTARFGETRVDLRVFAMDEALRVEVDGRAVAYLRDLAGELTLPLFGVGLPGETHVVRLVHLNDCGEPRPLVVQLLGRGDLGDPLPAATPDAGVDATPDAGPPGLGSPDAGCGCQGGGGPSAWHALLLLALAASRRRRG